MIIGNKLYIVHIDYIWAHCMPYELSLSAWNEVSSHMGAYIDDLLYSGLY